MKKIIGLVVLLVVLGGGFWLYQNFGNIAKIQTEKIASKTLGVPVNIGDLDISFKEKEIVLSGLTIGNPPGFKNDKIIKVDAIKVAADSLKDKTLVFNEIVIDGTAINFEVTQGGTNFTALQKLMAAQKPTTSGPKADTAAKTQTASSEPADPYKVIIKRLLINNATLTPSSTLTKANMDTFIMPDISMNSIGVKQGGVSASEAVRIVTANLSDTVLKTALKSGYMEGMSQEMLKDLKMQYDLSGAVVDKVKSDFQKAGEELKGLFGN